MSRERRVEDLEAELSREMIHVPKSDMDVHASQLWRLVKVLPGDWTLADDPVAVACSLSGVTVGLIGLVASLARSVRALQDQRTGPTNVGCR